MSNNRTRFRCSSKRKRMRGLFLCIVFGVSAFVLLLSTHQSMALPEYTARAARTCDNCHADPSGWVDPPLSQRVCTVGCSTCHVDPAGGGLRTVSGLYYGTQTLPAFMADLRPWADRRSHFFGRLPPRDWRDRFAWPDGDGEDAPEGPTTLPSSEATSATSESHSTNSLEPQVRSWVPLAWGTPPGKTPANAFSQDRYAGLNADPILRLGADTRYALLVGEDGTLVFPMQLDLGLALHPVHHFSLVAEIAGWGSTDGVGTEVDGEDIDAIGLHEAFLMTHEWPLNAYLKVGRFYPRYGTRLDDHTAFVRRQLGFDHTRPSTWVSGVEAGFNSNYPYLAVSAFRLGAGQHGFWPDEGEGFSAVAGWRDLGWGLDLSGFRAESSLEKRSMVGVSGYFNPWRFSPHVPVTLLVEVDFVALESQDGSITNNQLASFIEISWMPLNGTMIRLRHDFFDPDMDLPRDYTHALTTALDLSLIRHAILQTVVKCTVPTVGDTYTDILFMIRGWL